MAGTAQILIDAFETRYHSTPDIARAPGRVNLIGEHTDYNLGFVLPMAIDLDCWVASAPNRLGLLRVHTVNLNDSREWPVDKIGSLRRVGDWTDYVIGVAREIPLGRGRDVLIHGTVPLGAGLSSSAAIEVATALALGWEGPQPSIELAKLARRAENEFIGLPSGIMDQYASVFGQRDAALLIDCRSLESGAVPLPDGLTIMAVNSMVRHALGQSAYRDRVAECAAAWREMRVDNLREASADQVERIGNPVVRRRARHVLSENQRVLNFVGATDRGDLGEMGRLFVESHRSMQHDYEVTCEEIDFLVDRAIEMEGVFGARMTGGGFGGCTVNLVEPGAVARFEENLRSPYQAKFGITPVFYRLRASDGAARMS